MRLIPNSTNQRAPSRAVGNPVGGRAPGEGELGDDAFRRDLADSVAQGLGEPEVAVRAERNAPRRAVGRGDVERPACEPAGCDSFKRDLDS